MNCEQNCYILKERNLRFSSCSVIICREHRSTSSVKVLHIIDMIIVPEKLLANFDDTTGFSEAVWLDLSVLHK